MLLTPGLMFHAVAACRVSLTDKFNNQGKVLGYSNQEVNIYNDRNFPAYPNHDLFKSLLCVYSSLQGIIVQRAPFHYQVRGSQHALRQDACIACSGLPRVITSLPQPHWPHSPHSLCAGLWTRTCSPTATRA